MMLPDRLPRCAAPISGLSIERINFAALNRRVHDRSPIRIRVVNECVEEPVDFGVDSPLLLCRELVPLPVESFAILDVMHLAHAAVLVYIPQHLALPISFLRPNQ